MAGIGIPLHLRFQTTVPSSPPFHIPYVNPLHQEYKSALYLYNKKRHFLRSDPSPPILFLALGGWGHCPATPLGPSPPSTVSGCHLLGVVPLYSSVPKPARPWWVQGGILLCWTLSQLALPGGRQESLVPVTYVTNIFPETPSKTVGVGTRVEEDGPCPSTSLGKPGAALAVGVSPLNWEMMGQTDCPSPLAGVCSSQRPVCGGQPRHQNTSLPPLWWLAASPCL